MKSIKQKQKYQKIRKTKKIFTAISITAIVFIVATYAWFVGISQANINNFEIDIKSAEGLTLSLDGNNYTSSLSVSEEAITTNISESYSTNTNKWAGTSGLVPISSVGEMNTEKSVLNLFSKTAMTSTTGGYKLLADKVKNVNGDGGAVEEQDGYVVFDLFVKNNSDSDYMTDYNIENDEGVYLTKESFVRLNSAGEDVHGGEGLENSVRVAFMQIGRVKADSNAETVQKISCNSSGSVMPLCNKVNEKSEDGNGFTWNIWEPNDTKHTEASIRHFSAICKKRNESDYTSESCDAISESSYVNTYAIKNTILSSDNLNIYDGLNGYNNISSKIKKMDYFTDTKKQMIGAERPEIFYLAANSITKIRVYIYMEGQDVDNYDVDQKGRKINVSFGFTKDKYDINVTTTTSSAQ